MSTSPRLHHQPLTVLCVAVTLMAPCVSGAQDLHPLMNTKWWVNAGSFLSSADFEAKATGSIDGIEQPVDFERVFGFDDSPSLFMLELGWQFGEKWGVAYQYFKSGRDGSRVLEDTVEWQDDIYEVGVTLNASAEIEVNRVFFSRMFRDKGNQSLLIGAGLHWLNLEATLSGQARIDDTNTEFRASRAAAELPVPNVGAWYRYSPNDRWIFNARVDWLSASIDNYSGDIWNVSAGFNYGLTEHFGIGLKYQYFEIAARLKEPRWRGDVKWSFTGPFLYLSGYW